MITRVSLLPFDLGGKTEKDLQEAIAESGFDQSQLTQADEQLLGLSVSLWMLKNDNNGADTSIYLQRRGFAILVNREATETCFSDHEAVVKLLKRRQRLHQEIRSGTHPLARLVMSVRQQVGSRVVKRARQPLYDGVPYVFTFFVDEEYDTSDDIEHVPFPGSKPSIHNQIPVPQSIHLGVPGQLQNASIATLQGIVALSEPSRIGLADSDIGTSHAGEPVDIWEVTRKIGELDYNYIPPNLDRSSTVYGGATWASLVVIGVEGERGSSIHTYELLEVRTQIAWMAAHLVRRWCEQGQKQAPSLLSSQVDEIRWHIVPLFRRASHLSDARMSSRHLEILRGLTVTSALDQQIGAAEDAIQWTFEALERSEHRRRQRFELTVELLLGVFAVLQLATLVSDVPLVSLPKSVTVTLLVALASGLGYIIFRNRR